MVAFQLDSKYSPNELKVLGTIFSEGIRMPDGETIAAYEPPRSQFPEEVVVSLLRKGLLREISSKDEKGPRIGVTRITENELYRLLERGLIIDVPPPSSAPFGWQE